MMTEAHSRSNSRTSLSPNDAHARPRKLTPGSGGNGHRKLTPGRSEIGGRRRHSSIVVELPQTAPNPGGAKRKSKSVAIPKARPLHDVGLLSMQDDRLSYMSMEERYSMYDRYQTTGDFKRDLTLMCGLIDIDVSVVNKVEVSENLEGEDSPEVETKQVELFRRSKRIKIEISRVGDIEDEENNNSIFNNILKERVDEMSIRNCHLELPLINALTKTVPDLMHLKTLNMWDVGLTDESLYCLGMCLNLLPSLENLVLDGNDGTDEQRFQVFLQPPSAASPLKLKHLSLRHCKINQVGAENLGEALTENKHLITLNLCFNSLGDEGIALIAAGLRLNRTLVSLDLGSNGIGDTGLKSLSDILRSFALTHEETLLRRRLILARNDPSERLKTLLRVTRPLVKRSTFKNKSQLKKDLKGDKRNVTNPRTTPTQRKTAKPDHPGSQDTSPKRSIETLPEEPPGSISENNALESEHSVDLTVFNEARMENDELWVPGNRCLVNLNLSRNRISSEGLQCLHSALQHQSDVTSDRAGTGLLRLSLQKNKFRTHDEVYEKIVQMMRSRDPVNNRKRVYVM